MFIYFLAILGVLLYFILKHKHSYWTRRKIVQEKPRFLLGSVDKRIFKSGNPTQFVRDAYWNLKKKGVKHGGMYLFYTPIWIPIDLNLIKQILVTDYESFSSHGLYHHKNDFISENIFTKEGEEWKTLRSNLSPTFTPAKLKTMYDILYNFGHHLEAQIADSCSKRQAIRIRETTASYLTDVIAACFFGIEADRLKETKREFEHYGNVITQPRPLRLLLESLLSWNLLVSLGYNFFPKKVTHFFSKLIKEAVDAKERNNLKMVRKDYLDIVMQLMKDGGHFSFEELVANSTFMYIAGYETSTSALSYLMFELAKNQDVQNKLRSEILSIGNNNAKGEITYEDLSKMKYADMCITEILRCYPALPQLPRACTKEYRIPGTDQIIEKGTLTLIPIWAIQNDPDYFRNPTKFDPENMSSENKNSNVEDAWFGFGYGPRLCLGYKFAAMQIKIALLNYLRNYKYTLNDKTPENLTFDYDTILLFDQNIFGSGNPTEYVRKAYWDLKKKGAKHGGIYLFYNPVWIPIDLKLIKKVLVTDYDHFSSHGFFHHKKDSLSENLFQKEGDEWKVLRSHLSPTFTPSKLKNMYATLYKFGHRMEERNSCKKGQPLNIRDTTTSYLITVIASCFFGIESKSLDDPNSDFKHYGKLIAQSRPLRFLVESLVNWDLLAHLGYSFFPWAVRPFFTSLIKDVVDEREKNSIIRKDCLDTLYQMSKNGGPLTFQDVVATSTFLYAAGYETSSSTLSYLMYELAKNQDVQDKLRSEILSICKDNAELTYEDLSKMKYADLCLAEILRCYPALAQLPRACTKEYRIPGTDQVIEKGTTILIPVWAIQNDPEYFRNPTMFDPENMSPENQNSNVEDAWFAFGYGPRLCLGYKFAQMEIKVALVKYLKNHRYKLNIATPEELTFNYDTIVLYPAEDIILDIEAIN
ncbi:hypothetical protein HUJ04_000640 [Dendroctonus ponderosae]|nr:hypothetical protein HUJ04_000640 [Dendroctonus ponderosae]